MYNYLFNTGTVVCAQGRINGVEMRMPYKYAVIDITSYFEEGFPKKLVDQAIADAKKHGIKDIKFLKGACAQDLGIRSSWVTKGQKNLFRGSHNPDMVYLIDYGDSSALARARWLWSQYAEPEHVKLIAKFPGLIKESYYKFDNQETLIECDLEDIKMLALVWSKALGFEFSGPIYFERADMNTMCAPKRNTEDTKSYKPYADMTYRQVNKHATKKELLEFYEGYKGLKNKGILEEALMPGWFICSTCGAVEYAGEARVKDYKCPYCDTVIVKANLSGEILYKWQETLEYLPPLETGCKHSTGNQYDEFIDHNDYEYIQDSYLEDIWYTSDDDSEE